MHDIFKSHLFQMAYNIANITLNGPNLKLIKDKNLNNKQNMANSDNKCANLNVKDYSKEITDTFAFIYNKQIELQERLGFNFQDLTLKEIADFWMVNKHALSDEINEMFDALGGIDDGIGAAAWKYWKQDNKKAAHTKVSDLTDKDRLELYYEFIDGLHFYLNFGISIGMTSQDIVNLYAAKNDENHRRKNNGY